MKTEEEQKQYLQGLYDSAVEKFQVTQWSEHLNVARVSAEASTGSRYTVVLSRLDGMAANAEGGHYVVTVLQPWQTAYPLYELDEVDPAYVAEKWLRPGREWRDVHWGDWAAIVETINYAIRNAREVWQ